MAYADFYLIDATPYSGDYIHSSPYDRANVTYVKNGQRVRQIGKRLYGTKVKVKLCGFSNEGFITTESLKLDPDQAAH